VHSNSIWRHGLFYFKGGVPGFGTSIHEQERTFITSVIYVAWTTFGGAIIILVGSPNNILGDKVAPEGVFVPGTSGVEDAVRDVVASFETDEPNNITSSFRHEPPEFSNITLGSRQRYTSSYGRGRLPLPGRQTDWFSLSLAQFCLTYFSDLPQVRLETVFRVFTSHRSKGKNFLLDLEKCSEDSLRHLRETIDITDFPDFPAYEKKEIDKWQKFRDVSERNGLGIFSKVFLGSPIYTALGR
jgi:hypothetical protein